MKKKLTRLSFSIPSELYESYRVLGCIRQSATSPKKLITETLETYLESVRAQVRAEVGDQHYEFVLDAHARWAKEKEEGQPGL